MRKIPRVERHCLYCGNQFLATQNKVDKGGGKYCSCQCRANALNRSGTVDLNCPQCGNTYTVKPGRVHLRTYCSLKCAADAITTRVKKTCEVCGNAYEVKACEAEKSHYCSYECAGVGKQLAQSSRSKPTKIEVAIDKALAERGIPHECQFVVGRCILDIALPKYRLNIECDGDYWHNRPGEKEHDKARDKRLKQRGWDVLRFSETEIKASPSKCVDRIEEWLENFAALNKQLYLL